MAEHVVASSQAQCFVYDASISNWKALAEGLVNLYIYHHPGNVTYRVIGMNAQNQPVVNAMLFADVTYSHATADFHTWTDAHYAYGVRFLSEEIANKFSEDFGQCVAALKGGSAPAPPPPATPAPAAPEPVEEAPPAPAAPTPASAGSMTLAEQLAAKKLKKAAEQPAGETAPAPPVQSGGGGGGNMMDELAAKLKRRPAGDGDGAKAAAPVARPPQEANPGSPALSLKKTLKNTSGAVSAAKTSDASAAPARTSGFKVASKAKASTPAVVPPAAVAEEKAAPEAPPLSSPKTGGSAPPAAVASANVAASAGVAAAAAGGLKKEDLDKFKEELLTAFREELQKFKREMMAEIVAKMGSSFGGGSGGVAAPLPPADAYYGEEEQAREWE